MLGEKKEMRKDRGKDFQGMYARRRGVDWGVCLSARLMATPLRPSPRPPHIPLTWPQGCHILLQSCP